MPAIRPLAWEAEGCAPPGQPGCPHLVAALPASDAGFSLYHEVPHMALKKY